MLWQHWWPPHFLWTSEKKHKLIRNGIYSSWLSHEISTWKSPKECKALADDCIPFPGMSTEIFFLLQVWIWTVFVSHALEMAGGKALNNDADRLGWENPSQRCPAWAPVTAEVTLIRPLAWPKCVRLSVQGLLKAISWCPQNLASLWLCLSQRAAPYFLLLLIWPPQKIGYLWFWHMAWHYYWEENRRENCKEIHWHLSVSELLAITTLGHHKCSSRSFSFLEYMISYM